MYLIESSTLLTSEIQIKAILGVTFLLLADQLLYRYFHTRHDVGHTISPNAQEIDGNGRKLCMHTLRLICSYVSVVNYCI